MTEEKELNSICLPLKTSLELAIHLSGIPSAVPLCLTIIKELHASSSNRKDWVEYLLRLALRRGNLALVKGMDKDLEEAKNYLDTLKEWAEAPPLIKVANNETENWIVGMLEYYCDCPEPLLNFLASRCSKSFLNKLVHYSFNQPYLANWRDLGYIHRNRLEIDDVLNKLILGGLDQQSRNFYWSAKRPLVFVAPD